MHTRLLLFPLMACTLVCSSFVLSAGAAGADKKLPPPVVLPAVAKEISISDAATLVEAQRVNILDIRTAGEVKEQGRISGSKHLDFLREDFATAMKEQLKLDPAKPVLVYCALGGRARHAAQRLADLGFKEVLVLKDGYNAWKKAGLPVEVVK
ncbi:MAG: rhodanese-like domain-containing protein [Roseimicrobium sp.]